MESLRSYILESKFIPAAMAKALFSVLPLVEATNINKDFLVKEAGSPEALATAKQSVNAEWAHDEMDGIVRNQNVRQKVLNILYLMEIRKPGFTTPDILKGIHDLAIHNSLEQRFLSKVNSDTLPDQAAGLLSDANEAAVQSAKPYPALTPAEEEVWNRVKVYHEFPDGFRWVYAVNAAGKIATHMPSSITAKTMHHCGNQPSANSDNQYWELRDASGKAYLTVILNGEGRIEESKSWGNQPNKYRRQILPYVKWFLMDRKVTGVGRRYDYGYSTHTNFGVKDFIGEDNEFVEYVLDNKPDLLGNTEKRTLFWKTAIDEGIVSVDTVKSLYADRCTVRDLAERVPGLDDYRKTARFNLDEGTVSLFGENPFEVVCAACGGCPYDSDELKGLIADGTVSLEEFANYDIKLLTPEIQKAFVQARPRGYRNNLDILMDIAAQVASFSVSDDAIMGLIDGEERQWDRLFQYLANANPPSKVSDMVHAIFSDGKRMDSLYSDIAGTGDIRYSTVNKVVATLARYPDIKIPRWLPEIMSAEFSHIAGAGGYYDYSFADSMADMDDARLTVLVSEVHPDDVLAIIAHLGDDYDRLVGMFRIAVRCGWEPLLGRMVSDGDAGSNAVVAYTETTGKGRDKCAGIVIDAVSKANHMGSSRYGSKIMSRYALAHGLCMFPEIIGNIDWTKNMEISDCIRNSAENMSNMRGIAADSVDRVVAQIVRAGVDLFAGNTVPDNIARIWLSAETYANSMVNSVVHLVDSYGIDAAKYSDDVTAIVEHWMESVKNTRRVNNCPYLEGQGSLVNFPMDRWKELADRYHEMFLVGYVLNGGAGRGLSPETAWPALLDILNVMPESTQDYILSDIGLMRRSPNIASLVRELGERLSDGRLKLNISQLGTLMKKQMIPARTIRALMSRQDGDSSPDITSEAAMRGLINSFHKMTKVDALPRLVKSAVKTTTDYLYDNLGLNEDLEWKGDDAMYSWYMNSLLEKMTARLDKYLVAKAFLELADDKELIERLQGYKAANRDAVKDREPKWSCDSEREVEKFLRRVASPGYRAEAEQTVREKAPKPKAPRTMKKTAE